MRHLDKILDPERWSDNSYGDYITQVSSPTGVRHLELARLELAQLRRAVEALTAIVAALDEDADENLRCDATHNAIAHALRSARAVLAEIDTP